MVTTDKSLWIHRYGECGKTDGYSESSTHLGTLAKHTDGAACLVQFEVLFQGVVRGGVLQGCRM